MGLRRHMDKPKLKATALISHFGYGTTMGAIYGVSIARVSRNPVLALPYGIGIWAAGYLGWLPAMDILPSATEQPRGRSLMMVAPTSCREPAWD